MLDIEKALTDLNQSIAKLKLDYERFLAGVVKITKEFNPERERERIAVLIRQLNDMVMLNSGQRFYFQTLMSRFHTYCELWARLLRAKEEGLVLAAGGAPVHRPQAAARKTEPPVAAPDRSRCILQSANETSLVGALFERFIEMRSQTGEGAAKLSLPSFQNLIQGQYEKIASKYGPGDIEFRLGVKDGKVQLTAKPVGRK